MNILNKEELRRQIREGKEISLDGIFSKRVQAQEMNLNPFLENHYKLQVKKNLLLTWVMINTKSLIIQIIVMDIIKNH